MHAAQAWDGLAAARCGTVAAARWRRSWHTLPAGHDRPPVTIDYDQALTPHLRAHPGRRAQERGVLISMTDCYRESDYGEPIVALKRYILSPFSEKIHVRAVPDSIWGRGARSRPSRR